MKDIGPIWIDTVRVATMQPCYDVAPLQDPLAEAERDADFAFLSEHADGATDRPRPRNDAGIGIGLAFFGGLASGMVVIGVLQSWVF